MKRIGNNYNCTPTQKSKRRGYRNPFLSIVSLHTPHEIKLTPKQKLINKILKEYEEKKPLYHNLITVLKEIINKKYNSIFKKDIEKGAFSKNSDFFKDIIILSNKNIPFEIQKEILLEILPNYIYSIKTEELEDICNKINSCGPVIRSRIFFYLFCNTFNKTIIRGNNPDLKRRIYFFKKERIINRLKKFNDAYYNNEIVLSNIFNRIFRITELFNPNTFEDIFTICLDMILKYNKKNIKTNHIRKGKCIMKYILSIMENHKGDLELLKKLLNLAVRKKTRINIEKIFKDLNQKAQKMNSIELIYEIDLIIKQRGK
ncbi:hypothetical protein KO317_01785 [Candidatus Micrarchaeota archaeon]|nr:hypothetical protein [Candidatus Micrarchaeota archaeon]